MTAPERYGRRNVPKMIRQINDLRSAIRAEGTPSIQDVWDTVEEHIDFAYRRTSLADALALPEVQDALQAAEDRGIQIGLRAAAEWARDEADKCDDATKWGGHRKYVADCKAAAYALRNAVAKVSALTPAAARKIGGGGG